VRTANNEPPTLDSIGLDWKEARDVLSSGHVAKVFPHSGNYNGLGRGLFRPGVPLGQAERGLSEEERDG